MALIRDDEADIRLSVNGKSYFDTWLTYKGGALTATSAKSRSGGMGSERAAGGPATRSDIELTIEEDDVVLGFHNELEGLVRISASAIVGVQYLNPDRSAIPGAHFTRRGVIIGAFTSDIDGETNSPNVGKYTVTISADELAA